MAASCLGFEQMLTSDARSFGIRWHWPLTSNGMSAWADYRIKLSYTAWCRQNLLIAIKGDVQPWRHGLLTVITSYRIIFSKVHRLLVQLGPPSESHRDHKSHRIFWVSPSLCPISSLRIKSHKSVKKVDAGQVSWRNAVASLLMEGS